MNGCAPFAGPSCGGITAYPRANIILPKEISHVRAAIDAQYRKVTKHCCMLPHGQKNLQCRSSVEVWRLRKTDVLVLRVFQT